MKATKPTLQELKYNLNLAEKEIAEWVAFKADCLKKIEDCEKHRQEQSES